MRKDDFTPINVKHIEAYEAISATGSTISAATKLGISQSNASRLLHQLEKYLGVRLFDRDKNRLSPTREGLQLGPEIRSISDRLHTLKMSARELESGRSGEILLRLAFPASLTLTALPRLIRRFRGESPDVRIEITSGNYLSIERAVADRRADLGFIRLPSTSTGLRQELVVKSSNICVMHEEHPLVGASAVSFEDLKGHDLILLNRERPIRHELESIFYKVGLRKKAMIEAHSVGCACSMAAEGLGIAIVSSLIAKEYSHLPLRFVMLEPTLPVDYAIVSPESHHVPKIAQAFFPYLKDWASAGSDLAMSQEI
jgi:DNA-binding transcriptional LysR family regulator